MRPNRFARGTTAGFSRSRQMARKADGHYFANRELSERELSRSAPHPRAAAAHQEMADRYEALATVFGAKRLDEPPADYPQKPVSNASSG